MPSYKPAPKIFTEGRLSKAPNPLVQQLNEAPRLAWELKNLSSITQVDRAHVVMLARQGYMTSHQATALLTELQDIQAAGPAAFTATPGYGSMVLQMEMALASRLGDDIAGRLPIGRSRLDQGATVRRIVDRASLQLVIEQLLDFQETLIATAAKHRDTTIISYTHLQQAQPATFGHYLLAYRDRLQDCFQQLTQIYQRTDRCPLGAVGLSGTTLDIDRELTARLLGFPEVLDNSRIGRDAYYQIEIVFALALVMTILNDLCTDLHVYSSVEYGIVELDDSLCTTSSIFPQKKNPYALETVKGKAGEALGWVVSAMALFRNEGSGDTANRSCAFVDEACGTVANMLRLTNQIVQGTNVNRECCEELLSKAWVTTNRLGNVLLVNHQLDYRSAHSLVGRLVKNCLEAGVERRDVTVAMLQEAASQMAMEPISITQDALTAALDHTEFIKKSISAGSIGPRQFERLFVKATKQQCQNLAWLDETARRLEVANKDLDKAAAELRSQTSKGV